MRNLLKSDLTRIFRDKLLLITCIIGAAFALASPLLYTALTAALDMEAELGMIVDAKTLFFAAFLPGDNFGLVLTIFITIILCKDFSYGTIRNKIVCGKSRRDIFLSLFLSCAIVLCTVIVAHALLTLLLSICFFPYQEGGFTGKDFLYLVESIALEILVYMLLAALITFLCVSMKNTGLTIVCVIAVSFLCALVGGIAQIALQFTPSTSGVMSKVLEFLTKSNLFTGSIIGQGTSYTFKDLLYVLIPAIAGCAALIGFGICIFKKKDVK